MTLRLVALMSIVLLLSLAAFGLVANHYQKQVIREVERTASDVGRAALSTLDWKFGPHLVSDLPFVEEATQTWVWKENDGAAEDREVTTRLSRVIAVDRFVSSSHDDLATGVQRSAVAVRCQSAGQEVPDCIAVGDDGTQIEAIGQFFISIDGVRVESDPAKGMILKIPTLTPGVGADGSAQDHDHAYSTIDLIAVADEVHEPVQARLQEIHLPISTAEYSDLFSKLRRRSLYLFFGVFLVATVLSAGLASRFTRPIRKLDAALHELSEGDLDAAVSVRGQDEVARLGRAFNDMTRKLRAHRERSREVVRAEKLSALGRLAAGVAHDVRNPLHSIGLTLQHLRETGRPTDDERAAEFDRSMEIIRGEIRRLDQLVGNFLRFANGDRRGERHPLDLAALLRETEHLIRKEAEWRNVRLNVELADGAPEVEVDGEAVRSSILNLVLNSFEAMPDGGELALRLTAEDDAVVVEVADTGVGITLEDQEKVFDFAYTTREGGSGLGLAMVHQCVVADHGGRVALHSAPGEGTRVRLSFPTGPAAEETPS